MPTLEVAQLTPKNVPFSAADLSGFLTEHNPADHVLPYDSDDPCIATIPGKPDLLLRWIETDDPQLLLADTSRNVDSIADHVATYERELSSLGALVVELPEYNATYQIRVPLHTTFHVPHDPHRDGQGMLYTVVERIPDVESYPKPPDFLWGIPPRSPLYGRVIGLFTAISKYHIRPAITGLHIADIHLLHQYNMMTEPGTTELLDIPSCLMGAKARELVLHDLRSEIANMQDSRSQETLLQELDEAIDAVPA